MIKTSNRPLILHTLFVRELKHPCAKPKARAEPRTPAACPWNTAQPTQGPGQEGQRWPQPWPQPRAQLARSTVPTQSHSELPRSRSGVHFACSKRITRLTTCKPAQPLVSHQACVRGQNSSGFLEELCLSTSPFLAGQRAGAAGRQMRAG